MRDSVATLAALRQRLSSIEGLRPTETSDVVPVGHAGIDAALHGGIGRGKLHELFASSAADSGSVAGFAAMLMLRIAHDDTPIVWLREETAQQRGGKLYGPGFVELGVDPARLVIGVLPDALSLLRAAAEVARCPEIGVAVIELWRMPRAFDLTASRRLAVAAEGSGVTVLMLRVDAEEMPSAAQTRWTIAAAPAVPLEANAPGFAALDIMLVRQRGGRAGGRWILEWNRDQQCFRDPAQASDDRSPEGTGGGTHARAGSTALPRFVVPVPARRPAGPQPGRRTG